MIKHVFIAIQFIGILFLSLSQKQDIKVTHDIPTMLKPGEEVLVSIVLDKSDVMGFAKFQITLDEGLTVESVDAAGASFTFNNQVAKFIWMSLPSNRKVEMKVRIKATEESLGILELNQRFSYIYNNERKNFDAPSHSILVGEGTDLSAMQVRKALEDQAKNIGAKVQTSRSVSTAGVNQWRVDIEVEKEKLQGFAKIEETLPYGYTAVDLKSSGAIFSIDDQQIKYIWYDFPETDRITISYKMLPVIAMQGEKPTMQGTFSFLQDEETVAITIGDELVPSPGDVEAPLAMKDNSIEDEQVSEPANLQETSPPKTEATAEMPAKPSEEEKPNEALAQEVPAAKPVNTPAQKPQTKAPVKPEPEAKTTTTEKAYTDANIVDVPPPEEGIFYRVQIAAGKNNLQPAVFIKIYNFKEGYKLENHGSWIKYTTGHFQVYRAARDDRERIKTHYDKFQGPFVTAYNDGERITVQEALMVTKQKWMP